MEEIKLNERMMTIATLTSFNNKNLENKIITYEKLLVCNNHHNNNIGGKKNQIIRKRRKKKKVKKKKEMESWMEKERSH